MGGMTDEANKIDGDPELDAKLQSLGIDKDSTELARWIYSECKTSRDDTEEWRKEAHECYDFVASRQWSDDDIATLEEHGRPVVVFNRIARTINSVAGLEVQNRQEVRYLPRTNDDTGQTDILTQAAAWVRDNCDAEDEESDSFRDMLICGMGWTETALDYDTDPEGQVRIDRDDPLEHLWDTTARKRNVDDAKWVARIRDYSLEQFRDEFGEPSDMGIFPSDFWGQSGNTSAHEADQAWKYENDQAEGVSRPQTYSVGQFQWYEKVPMYLVQGDVTGRILEFDEDRFEKIRGRVDASGLQYVKVRRKRHFQAFFSGNVLIDVMRSPVEGFTFRSITGIRDRNRNTFFGLGSLMLDPQRWANKWLSQSMHVLNSNAKGGLLAEVGAFEDPRKAEDEWAEPNSITWLTEGGLGKVMAKEAPQWPQGLDKLLTQALDAINDVPGVSPEMLGLTQQFQSGVVELSRKQAGLSLLAPFFDALRRYRKEQGRILAEYINKYISDGRLIRITGPGGAKHVPLMKQPDSIKYDVIVDESPTSPNMKERTFAMMVDMLPVFQASGLPVPPEIIEYSPLPADLIEKWLAMIQQSKQPNPMAQAAAQLEMKAKETEVQYKQSQAALNMVKARKEAQSSVDEQMQRQEERVVRLRELDHEERKTQLEHMRGMMDFVAQKQQTDADRANGLMEAIAASYKMQAEIAESTAQRQVAALKVAEQQQKAYQAAVKAQNEQIASMSKAVSDAVSTQVDLKQAIAQLAEIQAKGEKERAKPRKVEKNPDVDALVQSTMSTSKQVAALLEALKSRPEPERSNGKAFMVERDEEGLIRGFRVQ